MYVGKKLLILRTILWRKRISVSIFLLLRESALYVVRIIFKLLLIAYVTLLKNPVRPDDGFMDMRLDVVLTFQRLPILNTEKYWIIVLLMLNFLNFSIMLEGHMACGASFLVNYRGGQVLSLVLKGHAHKFFVQEVAYSCK